MSGLKNQRVVAIDSMTLVWGVREEGPDEKILHARYLFRELEQVKAQVIVPSIVVAEFVTPIGSALDRDKTIAAIGERFLIAPFDAKDAALAAELFNYGKKNRRMQKPGARVCLRSDALIVATAKNHGASEFYTDDDECHALAARVMTARKLPTIAPSLFEDTDGAH